MFLMHVSYPENMSEMHFFLQDEGLKLKDIAFRYSKDSSSTYGRIFKKMYIYSFKV